jgi:hypothetical protein
MRALSESKPVKVKLQTPAVPTGNCVFSMQKEEAEPDSSTQAKKEKKRKGMYPGIYRILSSADGGHAISEAGW